jgi:DNA invertase Pin-like site-specific DNA recombinase
LEAEVAGQRIGYVRVSTLDQNEKRQLDGQILDRVFTDRASGRDTSRPELTELLRFARNGDTVIVHSMDRLARNLDDLRALVQGLTHKGVRVEFVKESLVFTGEDSPMANLMLSVMGAFAEFERSLIRERQREGIALAKQRGAYKGRKKTLTPERAAELVQRAAKWNPQIRPRQRLRHQPGNGLPVPPPSQAGVSPPLPTQPLTPRQPRQLDGISGYRRSEITQE